MTLQEGFERLASHQNGYFMQGAEPIANYYAKKLGCLDGSAMFLFKTLLDFVSASG